MSGKKEKAIRKEAKKQLDKLVHKNMPDTQVPQQDTSGIKIIAWLEDFINLFSILTGEKPASITLTEVMYNAYIQEAMRHGEVLGLKPGFLNDTPVFNGVKLEKKSPITVTPSSKVETPSN